MEKKYIILSMVLLLTAVAVVGFITRPPFNNKNDEPSGTVTEQETASKNENSSVADSVVNMFNKVAKLEKSSSAIAEELSKNSVFDGIKMDIKEVQPGILTGFSDEIKNFVKGTAFSPVIGTIPAIGYVFETNDVESLLKELKESANLRWNVCTEADEMKSSTSDNLVMFIMAPTAFEE